MRKLDIGIHPIPARPLYLQSNRCLVSSTLAVSRLASFPPLELEPDVHSCMEEAIVGVVDVLGVPPEAKVMEARLAQHLARTYKLGDCEQLQEEDYQAQLLWCQGAAFHEDAVFDCILAVMMWQGAPRDLVLPHLDVVVPMQPGTVVLLDSAQPHGLLVPGQRVFEAQHYADPDTLSIFCTVDLPRDLPGLQALMAYEQEPRELPSGTFKLTDVMGVDERDGSWQPARFKAGQAQLNSSAS